LECRSLAEEDDLEVFLSHFEAASASLLHNGKGFMLCLSLPLVTPPISLLLYYTRWS